MKVTWIAMGFVMLAGAGGVTAYAAEGVVSPTTRQGAGNDLTMTKEQLQAKAQALRQQLSDNFLVGGDTQVIEKRMAALSERVEQMKLEESEKNARLKAVMQKISELSERGRALADSDPVVLELRKTADLRTADAERFAKLGLPEADRAAAAAAAEARVNLEQRREAVMASVGGGILPELDKQMVEISLDVEVLERMFQVVEGRLHELTVLDDQALELQHIAGVLSSKFKAGIDE